MQQRVRSKKSKEGQARQARVNFLDLSAFGSPHHSLPRSYLLTSPLKSLFLVGILTTSYDGILDSDTPKGSNLVAYALF